MGNVFVVFGKYMFQHTEFFRLSISCKLQIVFIRLIRLDFIYKHIYCYCQSAFFISGVISLVLKMILSHSSQLFFFIAAVYSLCFGLTTGVTGNMSPPKICPPRAKFPRKFVPPFGNLSPLQTCNVRLFKNENVLYFL